MSQVIDLEKARRLQIGRRHNRTFINFYKAVKDITRDPELYEKGVAKLFCNSPYTQGFHSDFVLDCMLYVKETKSFLIHRKSGTLTIYLKEPGK